MKLSRDWLSDYVDLAGLTDEEIASRLTDIGHAVEAIEHVDSDTIFEVEFTTNRVDAMSHLGLARELAASLGVQAKNPTATIHDVAASGEVQITIDDGSLCTRYTALVLRGVNVKPSNPRIARRLEAVGLRAINNIVDATNYVMLSLGHPLHAFDLDQVSGKRIRVRAGGDGETFRTLDGIERKIDRETVVIADGARAVGLGGVMGGENSEIGPATKNVLLECAHFPASRIRRTARKLALYTDAAYRFERGVDPNDTLDAIQMCADLILADGGEKQTPIDVVATPIAPRIVRLRKETLSTASAGMANLSYAIDLFRLLGMEIAVLENAIDVTVPTWRGDIQDEIDLVEEVLRFYGLNKIPSALPRVTTGDAHHEPKGQVEEEVRDLLVASGLTEAVTYSFVHPKWNSLFSEEKPLDVSNALTENLSSMRLSIVPGLIDTVAYNLSYGRRDGSVFEVGRTYHSTAAGPRERSAAAFVLWGNVAAYWAEGKRGADYFDAKGIVEALASHYHVSLGFSPASIRWMRRGQAAVAMAGSREVAVLGVVSKEMLREFDITGNVQVIAAEIDLERLKEATESWRMAPISRFPGVPMVLPMLHGQELQYSEIVEKIKSFNVPYLAEVGVWDRFVPEKGSGEIKTALGLWYQAPDRSLTQDEVTEIQKELAARVAASLPVKIIGTEKEA